MQCTTAFITYLFVIVAGRRVNYCGSRMCGNTDSHTFCQFPASPSPSCTGYIEAQLSKEEKSKLLARLNRRRNEAASGRLRGLPSAGDMLKLRWIEELAKEAQIWANQCRPPSIPEERDECRDLYSISVGQCIASVVGEAPGLRVESMVDMWYMQSLLYKGNVTSYVPYSPENDRHFYGDFGQMMWARSYMVGCGRSRFMIPWQGRLRSVERLVCNLSPAGPAPYRALWGPAAPATACPPRSHPDRAQKALCNYQFEMDESDVVDNTMTIEEHVLLNSVLEIEKNESLNGLGSLDELYLTNLAIVTMDDVESSSALYNPIQKRDIMEAIDTENVRDKQNESKKTRESLNYNNMNPKISKKKVSTIGRPKTYNMEELTEIGDDPKEDNNEIIEVVPKNFNDIYGDYIVETHEENETTVNEIPSIEQNVMKNEQTVEFSKIKFAVTVVNKINDDNNSFSNNNIDESIVLEENASNATESTDIAINGPGFNENITTTDLNETLNVKEKSVEDYLTDPETVRQLQQALDRMENEMQTSKITAKVRRELRELPAKPVENNPGSDSSTLSPEEERNKTLERGPMLNMVLKYMPYLKKYEGEFLGNPSSAGCVCPSVLLILSLCF